MALLSGDMDAPEGRAGDVLECLPATTAEIADELDLTESRVRSYMSDLRDYGYEIPKNDVGEPYHVESTDPGLPDLSDVEQGNDPKPESLTDRELYIARELQTGATVEELAEDLDERETVVTQHLRDLKRSGWQVYIDESAEHVAIEGDHTLRSSEHTGTRTRKANKWWEIRHNYLERRYKSLPDIQSTVASGDVGSEDWVVHMTDLHAGDYVRQDDGTVVYETAILPNVIDHITERAIDLSETHGAEYSQAVLLWGGDMVTNEGIYEGQFEDLDAWLDEQVDTIHDPLLRQVEALANRFPSVKIVCMPGDHGDMRASGTSKQANADLLVFKSVRNTVAAMQKRYNDLQNVSFEIGGARAYVNYDLRDGALTGHLRHGQDRDPQAKTSARLKEWMSTLLNHDFDVAHIGHHHVSGLIPWDGPPVVATGSPKPSGSM